ncbi:hypothetical protein HRG84_12370 [Flavisolibacter sp. BT320]|nr:hypothetical protein [Flavisolibacter longurius]
MLNLSELPDEFLNQLPFEDGTWQYATVCELSTTSEFWNRASLVILSKSHTSHPAAALLYLLQKEAKFLSLWEDEWEVNTPTVEEFITHLSIWGRFTNSTGKEVPVQKFWERYAATINGIQAEPSFEYSEEGKVKPFTARLVKEEIEQVFCFDEEWNEQNYFISTGTEWFLFNWVTMA